MSIHLIINKLKNIEHADLSLPSEKGMYAIVGENGCGKSTIMLALSLMIKKSSNKLLSENDLSRDSSVSLEICKLCLNGMPVPLLRNCYSIFNGTKYR